MRRRATLRGELVANGAEDLIGREASHDALANFRQAPFRLGRLSRLDLSDGPALDLLIQAREQDLNQARAILQWKS
jgi:hypothetical protein